MKRTNYQKRLCEGFEKLFPGEGKTFTIIIDPNDPIYKWVKKTVSDLEKAHKATKNSKLIFKRKNAKRIK